MFDTMIRISNRTVIIITAVVFLFVLFFRFALEENVAMNESSTAMRIEDPPFITKKNEWVDSVFQSLTPDQRIAQLFMIAAYPNRGTADKQNVTQLIKKYHVGGLIYFQGTAQDIVYLNNYYQSVATTPLLMAIDAEWGPAMRLKNTPEYPQQMMIGASGDENLIYQMGLEIGEQLNTLGIHMNFAPVIDVNNNAANPVIGTRSFGEDPMAIARKGLLYMQGLQDKNILAVAKHFPGHGDTDKDSHKVLPVVPHPISRLDSVELAPFRMLIKKGLSGIMTAHLYVPALDTATNMASSLSPRIVDSLLKQEMEFKGLVITDAMNMGGIANHNGSVNANVKAILAGNDIILMPKEVGSTIEAVKKAIADGKLSQESIDKRCKKILQAKYWAGLNKIKKLQYTDLDAEINKPAYTATRRNIIETSLTLIKNKNNILPFDRLDTLKTASLSIGSKELSHFQKGLKLYMGIDCYSISKNATPEEFKSIENTLKNYNTVIIDVQHTNNFAAKSFGITDKTIDFINGLNVHGVKILTLFAPPYALNFFRDTEKFDAILIAYQDDEDIQSLSSQLLFGAYESKGRLSVSISGKYTIGSGIAIKSMNRFRYTIPEEEGISSKKLSRIDSVVYAGIQSGAMPGCQILIARNGSVIWNKSYGYHTYRCKKAVEGEDIYDLASLTKVLATVPTLMYLYDAGKIDIKKPLSKYVSSLDTTNKKDMTIKDILLHQAGLKSWIPFYLSTIEPIYPSQSLSSSKYSEAYPIKIDRRVYFNKHLKYKDDYFSNTCSEEYRNKVAGNLFIRNDLRDTIFHAIMNSELGTPGKYVYSDLGFYLFYRMIEEQTGMPLNVLADSLFYRRLGAHNMGYNPILWYDKEHIAPTENDMVFRKQILQGYVHDPGAAMLGGISGHAGLFGNANDVAKIFQMYLNRGSYGNFHYIYKRTIDTFTERGAKENGNRRGLGFDKPEVDAKKTSPVCDSISPKSFGHSGFTGTLAWADPEEKIVYVFLSNRVYPEVSNNKLLQMNVRTEVQKLIYEAIIED